MIAEVKLWGTTVGYLANDEENNVYFTYDPAFITRGIEISPIVMPLRKEPYSFPRLTSETFRTLPGLFADSLPDKFGRKVINEYLISIGRDKNSLTPIEELLYIGKRGMGALEYYPCLDGTLDESTEIRIEDIASAARDVLKRRSEAEIKPEIGRLRDLIKIGSSAGGAKAKAIIAYNETTGVYRSGQIDAGVGFTYWIIKFDKLDKEEKDSFFDSYQTREEYAYYLMARSAGINMTECRLLKEGEDYHFMTKRFDRYVDENGVLRKLHMVTACGLAHIDYADKHNFSYSTLFSILERLRCPFEDRYELFRRMVYNVMASNYDDHSKNFSFLMDREGKWRLSPAYDLTYANDPNSNYINNHQCLINGKFEGITIDDLLKVGIDSGLNKRKMDVIIKEVKSAVRNWPAFAAQAEIPDNKALEDYANFVLLD
ncbi:MAG: type II toxin-antitoxin system HipA family toxin [Bacilli bacterium]|nr:type II toxin-antitoxin system HipA family toxin [Bacilli bacterium]